MQMLPRPTIDKIAYRLTGYTVFLGDGLVRHAGTCQLKRSFSVGSGETRQMGQVPEAMAALADHIAVVVRSGSEKEVIGVNTTGVVASVAQDFVRSDRAAIHLPRESVRKERVSRLRSEESVALPVLRALPLPAPIALCDHRKEARLGRSGMESVTAGNAAKTAICPDFPRGKAKPLAAMKARTNGTICMHVDRLLYRLIDVPCRRAYQRCVGFCMPSLYRETSVKGGVPNVCDLRPGAVDAN